MNTIALSLITSVIAAASTSSQPSILILGPDQQIRAASWQLRSATTLEARLDDGSTTTIEHPLMVENLQPARATAGSSSQPQAQASFMVDLDSGERLLGQLTTSDGHDGIMLQTALVGRFEIPRARIRRIAPASASLRLLPDNAQANAPCILTNTGDVLPGKILELTNSSVTFESDFGDTELPWDRVSAVLLNPASREPQSHADGHLIELADDQRWLATEIRSTEKTLSFRSRYRDSMITLDNPKLIKRIVLQSARLDPVVRHAPASVSHQSFFDEAVPLEVNPDQTDRPLAIGHRTFATGLTTRSQSSVAFNVPTDAVYLVGKVGLDPVRGRGGSCSIAVREDASKLYDQSALTSEGMEIIAVPVVGGGLISFETDFGRNGELNDVVNWCDLHWVVRQTASAR